MSYFGCALHESLSGASMALEVVNDLNKNLKTLNGNNKFLTPELRRMLCKALIESHFDYVCQLGTQISPKNKYKNKKEIKIFQNKFIWFCLTLDKKQHISLVELNR